MTEVVSASPPSGQGSSSPLVLVDGFYCAYRSAFAFQDLSTKDGRPSGMVFGFIRNLATMRKRWPGADIVICWDSPSTWRSDIYSEYKANRTGGRSAREKNQLYAAAAFCKHIGLTQALAAGHEADDVIGSMIDRSRFNIIFSRDRDFCQLVEDGIVQVYSPKTGKNPEVIFTEDAVQDKFGVHPSKLLLFRALRGDSSDNLPGVRRFPTKKIIELVEKHNRVEDITTSPDPSIQLTPYQTKALTDFQDQARINYDLMRIRTDIEVRVIEGTFSRQKALEILEDYELKSLRTSVSLFEEQEQGLMGLFDA